MPIDALKWWDHLTNPNDATPTGVSSQMKMFLSGD
jgi:hypothetical protein